MSTIPPADTDESSTSTTSTVRAWVLFCREQQECCLWCCWFAGHCCCWKNAAGPYADVQLYVEESSDKTLNRLYYRVDPSFGYRRVVVDPWGSLPTNCGNVEIISIPIEDGPALLHFLNSQRHGTWDPDGHLPPWCCDCCGWGADKPTAVTLEDQPDATLAHSYTKLMKADAQTMPWVSSSFVLTALLIGKPQWKQQWTKEAIKARYPGGGVPYIHDPYLTTASQLNVLLKASHDPSCVLQCEQHYELRHHQH